MKPLRIFLIFILLLSGCKKEDLPTLTTADVSSIGQTSAIGGGEVTTQGSSEVISWGICWSTSSNPTIHDSITVESSGPESFTSNLIGLVPGTEYFVKAYATNNSGTGYGKTKSFTTEPATVPEVTGGNVTSLTLTSVTIAGGKIISDGGLQIIDRGFCWNTIGDPTLSDNVVSLGAGSDTFSTTITGLESNTCYYVLAYGTNLAGTGYSKYDQIFPTPFPDSPIYPADSIFGKWKLIYSIGGSGGDMIPQYNEIRIDEFQKDSVFIGILNGDKYRECRFSVSGNVLKYSDMIFLYRIMIRGNDLGIDIIDTLGYNAMDYIWGYRYKRLE